MSADDRDRFVASIRWPARGLMAQHQSAPLSPAVVDAALVHAKSTGGTFIEALEVLVLAGARLEEHLPIGETPASEAVCVSAEVATLLEEYATHADALNRIRGVDAPPMTKGRAAELLITAACEELVR